MEAQYRAGNRWQRHILWTVFYEWRWLYEGVEADEQARGG